MKRFPSSTKLFLTSLCAFFLLHSSQAGKRYWVGSGNTSWKNTANWSISSGGSGGAGLPTSIDTVYFDNGGGNGNTDTTVNIKGLHIQSTYTGTLTQGAYLVTIGTFGLKIDAGTFTGSASAISLLGPFNQSGGTFTCTSSAMLVKAGFTRTGGTFNHNSGLIKFQKKDIAITGNTTFFQLEFTHDILAGLNPTTYTITSGTTLTTNNTLTISGTGKVLLQEGNIDAKGNVTMNNTATGTGSGGSATINITGTGYQFIYGSGVVNKGLFCKININKTGGYLFMSGNISLGNDWTYIQGTVQTEAVASTLVTCATLNVDAQGTSSTMAFSSFTVYTGTCSLTGNADINHGLTINSGATLNAGNYNLNLGESWLNNGTYMPGTGEVIFDGSASQTISKSTGTETYYKLKVNKPANKLRLSSPINIVNTLTLTKGIIKGNASNYPTLTDTADVDGGSDSSYVHGPMRKKGSRPFVFPLGDTILPTGAYHPLGISAPSQNTDEFEAQYFGGNPQTAFGDSLVDSLEIVSNCEYWTVKRTAGTSDITATPHWNTNGCNVINTGRLVVSRWDEVNSRWLNYGRSNPVITFPIGSITSNTVVIGSSSGPVAITFGWKPCSNFLSVEPDNASLCLGTCATLTASGATTYTWSPADGLSATTGASVSACPTSSTIYTVQGSIDGCNANAIATIIVVPITNFSGIYIIGSGGGTDYPDITTAINALTNCGKVTGAVEYKIRDGVYNEVIKLDSIIIIDKNDTIPILFSTENVDTPNVVIQAPENIIYVDGKSNIFFSGLILKTTSNGKDAIRIDNSNNIVIENSVVEVSGAITGNRAISALETDILEVRNTTISNYAKGIEMNSGDGLNIILSTISSGQKAINIIDSKNIRVDGNSITSQTNAEGGLFLNSTEGGMIINGNSFIGDGNNLFLSLNKAKTIIRENSFHPTGNGVGVYLQSFFDTIMVIDNTLGDSLAHGIRVKDTTATSDSLDNYNKFLFISYNKVNVGGTAIQLNRIKNNNVLVFNNTISGSGKGVEMNNIIHNANTEIQLVGNLVVSSEKGLALNNSYIPTKLRSNTIVKTQNSPGECVQFNSSDNISMFANNVVNVAGDNVAIFDSYNPSNITVNDNNWFSFTSGNITNRSDIILAATNMQQNPEFNENSYSLSYKSALLDTVLDHYDSLLHFDLLGIPRYIKYDIGAFESEPTGMDKLPITIVLDRNFVFYPNNTPGNYDEFVIDGLTNFTNVSIAVFDRNKDLVYQSASKTEFWDGIDLNTGALVQEGTYSYELVVDNRKIEGIVYVKL